MLFIGFPIRVGSLHPFFRGFSTMRCRWTWPVAMKKKSWQPAADTWPHNVVEMALKIEPEKSPMVFRWFFIIISIHFSYYIAGIPWYTPFPDTPKWEIIEHWILWAYFQTPTWIDIPGKKKDRPNLSGKIHMLLNVAQRDVHRIDPDPRCVHFTLSSPKDSTAVKVFFVVFPCCQSMDNLSYCEHVFWHL